MQQDVRTPVDPQKTNPLNEKFWHALRELRIPHVHLPGEKLFSRGRRATGIYVVEEGSVSLLWEGDARMAPVFETAGPGAVLGLAETMTGEAYRLTAEVSRRSTISFVDRESLLGVMRQHPEFCMQVVHMLSEDLHGLYHRFQSTPLSRRSVV
jgi:CRP-like cAMP-binding protein